LARERKGSPNRGKKEKTEEFGGKGGFAKKKTG